MNRDWNLNPPARVSGEYFDFYNNNAGNPTARLLLNWDNGKTGVAYDGGRWRSPRRVWYGYENSAADVGIPFLAEFFPGTRWTLSPEAAALEPRHQSRELFNLVRDYDAEPVPVIFRAETVKGGTRKVYGETLTTPDRVEVTAVFPTLPGTDDSDVTIYAHIGQHGTGARGWYQGTRPATDAEAASLKAELNGAPFNYALEPVKRWTRHHDAKRAATYHASREPVA